MTARVPPNTGADWLPSGVEEATVRVEIARRAHADWAARPVASRCAALHALADRLHADRNAWAERIHRETGKPYAEALAHDVGGGLSAVRWVAEHAPRLLADAPLRSRWLPHRRLRVSRRPFGVALIVSPWNFPLSIPLGQVAAALAAGNAVLLKPSEFVPEVTSGLATLFAEAGLPRELVQVVAGDGSVGAALIAARPDKVSFTGSLATGRRVMAACAAHPIPVSLELGGVDAMIVCHDADLELATSAALWGATFNGGQACASVERILVDARVHDAFLGRLGEKLDHIDPRRDLGRCSTAPQAAVWDRHLEDARQRGVSFVGDPTWVDGRLTAGFGHGPALSGATLGRDEVFGPLAAVVPFRHEDEAVRIHNATPYGLTASVFAGDPARAEALGRRLRAGVVSVNDVAATLHAFGDVPWGGVGASGFSRSHGAEGLLDYTWSQTLDLPRGAAPGVKRPWWYPYDVAQREFLDAFVTLSGARGVRRVASLRSLARGAAAMAARFPRV